MAKLNLFEGFGVELEYMIVDKQTLKAKPVADELIRQMTGEFNSDVLRGPMAWSNELVMHVIELKTNGPAPSLAPLADQFAAEVRFINERLEPIGAMLLPTGAHPLFVPETETRIWPHEYNDVYALYDRIFNCKGHGWSNLQSTHINLPFSGDVQFAALHGAIRALLPLLPALCASTPIIEGKSTGWLDKRMDYYRRNQRKIPAIAGMVVPEPMVSESEYEKRVFDPIATAIAPYDPDKLLDKYFLNSRGSIARFDRGAIEIRVIDIQECPAADVAVVEFVVATLKHWISKAEAFNELDTRWLSDLLFNAARYGRHFEVMPGPYLELLGLAGKSTLGDVLSHLLSECADELNPVSAHHLRLICQQGNLAERILGRTAADPSTAGIVATFRELAHCLATNQAFRS